MHVHQLECWLRKDGWQLTRSKGSHRQYHNKQTRQRVTLAIHGRKVDEEHLDNLLRDLRRQQEEVS